MTLMKNNIEAFDADLLINWYSTFVRPLFAKTLSEDLVAALDKDRDQLSKLRGTSRTEIAICFLGTSGIGKSTLINAIVGGANVIVPSGGVGPLTAQALIVRSMPEKRLEVEYHNAQPILRTVFGLEQMYKESLGRPISDMSSGLDVESLCEDELPAEEIEADEFDDDNESSRRERREQFRRIAQLLVTGSQDTETDLKYLLDSLREVTGGQRSWGSEENPEDKERLVGLRHALSLTREGKQFLLDASASDEDFRHSIHIHATGYLAPLIKILPFTGQVQLWTKTLRWLTFPELA